MKGGALVDDYCDKFEDFDGDQFAVLVVEFDEEGAVFYFVWEIFVPPETNVDGVSPSSFQATVAKQGCGWCLWYDMGDRCFPCNPRTWT